MRRYYVQSILVPAIASVLVACQGAATSPAKPAPSSSVALAPSSTATAPQPIANGATSAVTAAPVVGSAAQAELAKFEALCADIASAPCPAAVEQWKSAQSTAPTISSANSREIAASPAHAARRREAGDKLMTKLMACPKAK
jgi:hypothetical protein